MGAPIARALLKLKEGKCDSSVNCEIGYRGKEKYWVRGDKDKVTVLYTVHFDNEVDRALA